MYAAMRTRQRARNAHETGHAGGARSWPRLRSASNAERTFAYRIARPPRPTTTARTVEAYQRLPPCAVGTRCSLSLSAICEKTFIGRAELASAVHDWTPSEAQVYPGDSPGGVLLAQVEEWDSPVPMSTVLSQIDPAENARADFEAAVVRITANEYEPALAVAAGRATSTG